MTPAKVILSTIVLVSVAALQGCGGSSVPPSAVTMQKVAGTYYRVDINVAAASHYDIGAQYAQLIKNNVPDYEARIDGFLQYMIGIIQHIDPDIDFDDINERAHDIYENIPAAYQQEIQGMQAVFSYTTNTLGDGRLSQDKLLIFQLFGDVTRFMACSGSAAFGNTTVTGNTIVARSLEWKKDTTSYMAPLHAVNVFHNGASSVVTFGVLGWFSAVSAFSSNHIFAGTLDSEMYLPLPDPEGKRSLYMDVRYALENQTTLQGVATYLTGNNYAVNSNVILADANSAQVFEDQMAIPPLPSFSGLRTATSTLRSDIPPWAYPNALAAVNCFMLPGTFNNCSDPSDPEFWEGNIPRWNNFSSLYGKYLSQGKISMDVMKLITGDPGLKGDGNALNGAIFRYDDEPELQDIIVDMGTLETWVFFQPVNGPLKSPNYIQVFSGNPF
jgi:hypothetical protein